MLTIRTYNRVWRLERVLYRINDFRLPVPVTIRQIVVFVLALALAASLPLDSVPLLNQFFMRYLGLPGVIVWASTKLKLDGRNPLMWVWALIRFWFSARRWVRLQPYQPPARPEKVIGVVVVRRRATIQIPAAALAPGCDGNNPKEWRRR